MKVTFRRVRELTQDWIEEIVPLCTLSEGDHEYFVRQLIHAMNSAPQEIFILEARDESTLLGFVIARTERDAVFVAQLYSDNKALTQMLLYKLYAWASANGYMKLRAITQRDSTAWYRSFGFEQTASILEYSVPIEAVEAGYLAFKEKLRGKSL